MVQKFSALSSRNGKRGIHRRTYTFLRKLVTWITYVSVEVSIKISGFSVPQAKRPMTILMAPVAGRGDVINFARALAMH